MIPGVAHRRQFKNLSEQEILALAISSEEDDGRIYRWYAKRLAADFPQSARVFEEMAREEDAHRESLIEEHRRRFGDTIPLIRREHVAGFYQRRPVWLIGMAADGLGYVAQAIALALGSLVLVQPLLATSLLFALPLGAWWGKRRLHRSDGLWAIALTAGLAVFLVAGNPTAGVDSAEDGIASNGSVLVAGSGRNAAASTKTAATSPAAVAIFRRLLEAR